MTSASVHAKAMILILLLAGQEIHSMRSQVALVATQSEMGNATYNHPETSFQKKLNSECSWKGICVGEGCKLRPLPLDKGPSDSCRLSTAHMVNSPREKFEKYIELTTSLLRQKTSSFQTECVNGEGSTRIRAVCKRRFGEILQAGAFLQAAQQKLQKLPADQYAEARSNIEAANKERGKQLSDLFGDDTTLVLPFLKKVQLHPTFLGDNLRDVTLYTMKTIGTLLDGTDEEKENTRAELLELLEELPSGNPSSEESAKVKNALDAMGFNQTDNDWSKIEDHLSEATDLDSETSSLLDVQEWSQGCQKGRRTLLWLLVFFVGLTVIAYAVIYAYFVTPLIGLIMLVDLIMNGPIWRWTRCQDATAASIAGPRRPSRS